MAYVQLNIGDGSVMQAYTAIPVGAGPFPGIIIYQEAFGVNGHIKRLADRFAASGYIAIAPELFHRTAPAGFAGDYTDFASVASHFQALTDQGLKADIMATWSWLKQHAQLKKDCIVCTGYCLGGRVSFLTNTLVPVKAAVSYYGGRIAPDLIKRASSLHSPMLFFWGGLDKHIPSEQIDAVIDGMKKAEKPYTNVAISYADHGFFCEEKPAYNDQAANEAWALTTAFLEMKLR